MDPREPSEILQTHNHEAERIGVFDREVPGTQRSLPPIEKQNMHVRK